MAHAKPWTSSIEADDSKIWDSTSKAADATTPGAWDAAHETNLGTKLINDNLNNYNLTT